MKFFTFLKLLVLLIHLDFSFESVPVLNNPKADSFRSGSHHVISFESKSADEVSSSTFTIMFPQMSFQAETSAYGLAVLDDLEVNFLLSHTVNISTFVIEVSRDRIVVGATDVSNKNSVKQ